MWQDFELEMQIYQAYSRRSSIEITTHTYLSKVGHLVSLPTEITIDRKDQVQVQAFSILIAFGRFRTR